MFSEFSFVLDYLIASSTTWAYYLLTKGGSDTFPFFFQEAS